MTKNRNELPPCMRVKQVGEYLQLSPGSAYRLVRSKSFPSVRIGRTLIIPSDRFLNWLDEHTEGCNDLESK